MKDIDIRKGLGLLFAVTSLMYLSYFFRILLNVSRRHYEIPFLRERLIAASISVFVAAITGLACWNIWKENHSGRSHQSTPSKLRMNATLCSGVRNPSPHRATRATATHVARPKNKTRPAPFSFRLAGK